MIEADPESTILGVIPLLGQSTIGGRPGRQAKPAIEVSDRSFSRPIIYMETSHNAILFASIMLDKRKLFYLIGKPFLVIIASNDPEVHIKMQNSVLSSE